MDEIGEITRLLRRLDEEVEDGHRSMLQAAPAPRLRRAEGAGTGQPLQMERQPHPGTTSLVHEYLKLAGQSHGSYANRRQFFALASRAMRSIVVDNALARAAEAGRGQCAGEPTKFMLVSAERCRRAAGDRRGADPARRRSGLARIVECRCFGGLSVEETAEALALSPATIKRAGASLAPGWRRATRRSDLIARLVR